jgi:DNA-binding IclR family transcriptional regulator
VGSEIPVHATAVGRLYLGLAPEQLDLTEGPLPTYTPQTQSSREKVQAAAVEAARAGFAVNREEWLPGLVVAAAPVLRRGRLEAAVAVAGPAARLTESRTRELVRAVCDVAERISQRMDGGEA